MKIEYDREADVLADAFQFAVSHLAKERLPA